MFDYYTDMLMDLHRLDRQESIKERGVSQIH